MGVGGGGEVCAGNTSAGAVSMVRGRGQSLGSGAVDKSEDPDI